MNSNEVLDPAISSLIFFAAAAGTVGMGRTESVDFPRLGAASRVAIAVQLFF